MFNEFHECFVSKDKKIQTVLEFIICVNCYGLKVPIPPIIGQCRQSVYESLSKYVKIPVICMYISNDNDFIQNKWLNSFFSDHSTSKNIKMCKICLIHSLKTF
jgi:hypothetical protein